MIEVRGLSKSYGEYKALEDISFTVEKGQIVGFLGANGAGKTTTMDIMCGCMGADFGSVIIAGHDITEDPIEAKKKMGYLPDVPPVYPEMRVEEALRFVARLHGISKPQIKEKVDRAITKLSLEEVRHRLIGNLSKGYKQRVAFAQALVHDPEVLVLDEPTEGLDPNQIIHVRDLIEELRGDHTIILSSHILSEIQSICDRILIIHNRTIAKQGTYQELVESMENGHTYHLKVAKGRDELLREMEGMDGLVSANLYDQDMIEFVVAVVNEEKFLDSLTNKIVKDNFGLRELTLKTTSLEDVFIQITH